MRYLLRPCCPEVADAAAAGLLEIGVVLLAELAQVADELEKEPGSLKFEFETRPLNRKRGGL